jgi:hypothetical protein
MKEKMIFGVGLIAIVVIAASVICGNNQCNDDQAKATAATTDMLLQQKDVAIAKLFKQLRAKEAALVVAAAKIGDIENKLDVSNAILESAKSKIDVIKAEASSPIEVKVTSKK